MHYLAVSGTSYTVRPASLLNVQALMAGNRRNNVVTIAIGVMCACILGISTFLAVSDVVMAREVRRNARKVVVASVAFDKSGRLLVKADGSLPMVVLETKLRMTEVMDALDKRQTTFQWLYTISWDWNIVAPFLRAITSKFHQREGTNYAAGAAEQPQLPGGANKRAFGRRVSLDQTHDRQRGPAALADFRDSVIDAAMQLSIELDIPFEQVGILYDSVLSTGTRKAAVAAAVAATGPVGPYTPSRERADDESSIAAPSIFGEGADEQEGVTLFLVRELPTSTTSTAAESAERYRQRGFRVTETRFLASVLADRFAVAKPEMELLLDSLKVYAKRGTRPVVQPGGVYAGLFGVRPSTSKQGGLDVLVYHFARHQIPAYRLPEVQCITPEMKDFLHELDQLTLDEAGRICEIEATRSSERKKQLRLDVASQLSLDEPELHDEEAALEAMIRFQTALFIALDALHQSVRFYPKIASTARLSAEVLEVPSSVDDSTQPAEMILVQAVLPEENLMPPANGSLTTPMPSDTPSAGSPFVFTPYTLFARSQMMLLRGRQADDFEHEVVVELRRRYPSSLMQEQEEKAELGVRRTGAAYSEHRTSSSVDHVTKDLAEKDLLRHDDDEYTQDKRAVALPGAFRRWTSKLVAPAGARRASHEPISDVVVQQQQQQQNQLGRVTSSRRVSVVSSHSRHGAGAKGSAGGKSEHFDMVETRSPQGNTANLPVLNSDDPRYRSPTSPGTASTTSDYPSPLRVQATQGAVNASLGIRRFTQDGASAAAHAQQAANQSRFARSADDQPIAEEASEALRDDSSDVGEAAPSSGLAGAFDYQPRRPSGKSLVGAAAAPGRRPSSATSEQSSEPATPTIVSASTTAVSATAAPGAAYLAPKTPTPRRSSAAHPLRGAAASARPSTAPAGARRAASFRPHTADSHTSPVLSQRHAMASMEPASINARLRADGWTTRQLRALERGPNAPPLLGVDY
jgi:hypothetical protein